MSITGLRQFREALAGFEDDYVLIGGSACDLLMAEQGLAFRRTKDLDVVVLADSSDAAFARAFWAFVRKGGYQPWCRRDGRVRFYRFLQPKSPGYPAMIELFARHPDFALSDENADVAPLPFDEDVSSLSAIVLDDIYYRFIKDGLVTIDGVSVLDAQHIIPLKIRAHVDLNDRKAHGQHVNETDLRKHRKDVFRLLPLIPEDARLPLPGKIATDAATFMECVREPGFRIDQLGCGLTLDGACNRLAHIYGLHGSGAAVQE